MDLDLVLFLSTALMRSLNLSLGRRLVSPKQTNFKKWNNSILQCEEHKFARIAALDSELQELPVFATRWLNVHCLHLGLEYKTRRYTVRRLGPKNLAPGLELKVLAPYWYLISWVFNLSFLAIAKKSRKYILAKIAKLGTNKVYS